MEFVEFHGQATSLTTSSTITLSFDRTVSSAADVKGFVIYAIGDPSGAVTWTQDSAAGSVGIYDGTNQMCSWWGMNRGNTDESEYRHHWRNGTVIALWNESGNATTMRCSVNSISTTAITLDVDDVSGTGAWVSYHGFAIVGSDCSVEAKSFVQSTLTAGASTTLDFSTLASVDAAWGWGFSNDDITATGMADEAPNTAASTYRGHHSPGQWMACSAGTRAAWGMSQDGGTLLDTSVNAKTDGKVFGTVLNAANTNFHSYIDLGFQPGAVANRLTLTNNGAQSRGYGMIVLALETANDVAIGTMVRDASELTAETVSPGFTDLGLMSTVSLGGWNSDEDAPLEDQADGTQFGCNLGQGGFVMSSRTAVGSFGINTSLIDSNGAVRGKTHRWSGPNNVDETAMLADTDWYSRFCSVGQAPADTTAGTQNDISGMYMSAYNSGTGALTITHDDATATGTQNKGIRTYWMAVQEGTGTTGQTVTLTTSIGSEEAFDTQALVLDPYFIGVSNPGIATAEALGDPVTLVLTGGDVSDVGDIDDTTVFGLTELVANVNITPTEDIDESGVGSPELIYPQPIIIPNDAAIDSAEDFGTTLIQPPEFLIEVSGSGIAPPAGQVDDPILTAIRDVIVETSITTPHGQGGLPPQVPEPTLASQFQFLVIEDAGIETEEAFQDDAYVVEPNPVLTVVDGIESGEGFEDDANVHSMMGTVPESIESGEAFGTPFLEFDQFIDAEAVASGESVGKPFLRYPYLPMYPETVQPRENFGIPTIVGGEYRPYSTPTTALNASYDRAWEGNASLDVSWSGSAQSETQQDLSASSD